MKPFIMLFTVCLQSTTTLIFFTIVFYQLFHLLYYYCCWCCCCCCCNNLLRSILSLLRMFWSCSFIRTFFFSNYKFIEFTFCLVFHNVHSIFRWLSVQSNECRSSIQTNVTSQFLVHWSITFSNTLNGKIFFVSLLIFTMFFFCLFSSFKCFKRFLGGF